MRFVEKGRNKKEQPKIIWDFNIHDFSLSTKMKTLKLHLANVGKMGFRATPGHKWPPFSGKGLSH